MAWAEAEGDCSVARNSVDCQNRPVVDSLAKVYLGLGDTDRAMAMAAAAREAAEKAGNHIDLAFALSVLGAAQRLKGLPSKAGSYWRDAVLLLERLGHQDHAAKIRKELENTGLSFPRMSV
jgi:uncharacterized membrane protein YccC